MSEKRVIGLCDDQMAVAMRLKKIISDILQEEGENWEICLFDSGEKLLETAELINVVFLDIEMPGLDGIETGKELKRRNPDCKIIMATGKVERFKEAFHIQAMRFITKPFDKREIEEALKAVEKSHVGNAKIELYYLRNSYQIEQDKIQYIKAYNGYTEYRVENQVFRKDMSLNEVEKMLDKRLFVRIHRQYIINMRWIQSYSNGKVEIGDIEIDVSRRKRKDFEQKYIEYDLNYR